MPIGTPMVAVPVGREKPAGTVSAGKPVTEASAPLRSGCAWPPIGATRIFWCG